ncbi:MAG: DMT family transporter [Nocardioidaceae bacterium]
MSPRAIHSSVGTNVTLLIVGVIAASMSGPLMAAATAVPALAMSLWRTGLGAAVLWPFGTTRYRAELRDLPRREVVRSCFAGVMLAAHFATWTSSLKYTSVASATALVCLQGAWVVVLVRLSGNRVERQVWGGLALAFAGVLVVSGVDFSVSSSALTGDALAVAGGLFAAVYVVVGSRVRAYATTTAYTLICYSTSAAALLVTCLLSGTQIGGFDARSWLLIVAVTVVAQLLGHSIFNHVLATMSPTVVSLTLLLEVPGAALIAAVFLGQAPPVAVYGGLALILIGLAIVVRARAAQPSPAQSHIPLD